MADQATLTTIAPILNKVIFPKLQSLMAKKVIFLDKIKKNVQTSIANNEIYISANNQYHSGFYTAAEGSEPPVGKSGYLQMKALVKFIFLTYGFTDQALTIAMKSGKEAIAGTFDSEFNSGMLTAKKHLNRIFHGAATGKLCLANGLGSSSATLTVDGCPAVGGGTNHTKYLAPGQYILIGTTEAQISTVDSDTQVTLAVAKTWSDNDVVTLTGAAEPMGLAGHIDDGDNVSTYQNLLRSAYPQLKAQTDDTTEALSEQDLIDIVVRACDYGDGPDVVLMNQNLWTKYGALLLSMKRTNDTKLIGGFNGLALNAGNKELAVVCDYDCWDGYVQMPRFGGLTIAQVTEMLEWMQGYDGENQVLRRSPTVRTNWEGTQKWYMNLVGLQVNDMARLSNKTV